MKINVQNIRPILRTKKEPKVQDPPRIPKIMIPLERQVKQSYALQLNKMLIDLTDKMIQFSKINS